MRGTCVVVFDDRRQRHHKTSGFRRNYIDTDYPLSSKAINQSSLVFRIIMSLRRDNFLLLLSPSSTRCAGFCAPRASRGRQAVKVVNKTPASRQLKGASKPSPDKRHKHRHTLLPLSVVARLSLLLHGRVGTCLWQSSNYRVIQQETMIVDLSNIQLDAQFIYAVVVVPKVYTSTTAAYTNPSCNAGGERCAVRVWKNISLLLFQILSGVRAASLPRHRSKEALWWLKREVLRLGWCKGRRREDDA